MRQLFYLLVFFVIISSCSSAKKYNEHIATFHSVEDLQNDLDKLYKQLKRHHPNLYQYTSKLDLDFKFDSLKQAINEPMDTRAFYKKVAPVVAYVKHGHIGLGYATKKLSKKDYKIYKKQTFEFYDLEFEYLEDKLWVKRNYGNDSTLVGCEVLNINDESLQNLIKTYKTRFASDGFNTTLHNRYVSKGFSTFYVRDKGFTDSLNITFKNTDSIFTKHYKRMLKNENQADTTASKAPQVTPKKLSAAEKKTNRLAKSKQRKDHKKYGYLSKSKTFTRNLDFIGKDSSVAYMKIKSFTNGSYKKFYEESFFKIDSAKTKHLIIDLRDNGGGRIAEIDYLYSFLTDTNYQFINASEVTSRIPFLKSLITNTTPIGSKVLVSMVSPLIIMHNVLKTKKEAGKLYYRLKKHTKPKAPNALHFKGAIYVLINGNSFSASSLIATHLKANKRAIFVGEENGRGLQRECGWDLQNISITYLKS